MTADISSFGESFKKEVLPYINTLSFPNTMLIEGGSAELRLSAARFYSAEPALRGQRRTSVRCLPVLREM